MKRRNGRTLHFTGKAAQEVFDALTRADPPPIERVREFTSIKMVEILSQFKPGALITVLVRTPGKDGADFVLTNEVNFDEVGRMIERTKKRAPV